MLSFVRKRLSYANIAVTAALLFAMAGGALAASGPAREAAHKAGKAIKGGVEITSIKQISKKVLSELKGNAGPVGPAGKEGAAGKEGPAGKEGVGKEGKEGKPGPPGEPGKEGPAGQTGFTETLPEGKTETGVWVIDQTATEQTLLGSKIATTAVSFNIPLAAAALPPATKTPIESLQFVIGPGEGEGEGKEAPAITREECKGTVDKPEAAPGRICVFTKRQVNVHTATVGGETAWWVFIDPNGVSGKYGAEISAGAENGANPVEASGTYAVTA